MRSYFFHLPAPWFIFENHSIKSSLLEKLFGRTSSGFSQETVLGALPNRIYMEGSKWRSDSCQLATKIELYIYRSVHIYRIRSEEEAGSGRPDTITCAPLLHFQKRIAVCCYQRDSLLLKQCRRSGKWFWWLPEAEKHQVPFQNPNACMDLE